MAVCRGWECALRHKVPDLKGLTVDVNEMWDALLDMGVSEDTLQVVTSINGYNTETMHDVLYVVFGERTFDNYDEDEEN